MRIRNVRLAVESGSADYSSTTDAPYECSGQASSIRRPMSDEFFHYTRTARVLVCVGETAFAQFRPGRIGICGSWFSPAERLLPRIRSVRPDRHHPGPKECQRLEASARRFLSTCLLIDQHNSCSQFNGERDCLAFSKVELGKRHGVLRARYFEPVGMTFGPLTHRTGAAGCVNSSNTAGGIRARVYSQGRILI